MSKIRPDVPLLLVVALSVLGSGTGECSLTINMAMRDIVHSRDVFVRDGNKPTVYTCI